MTNEMDLDDLRQVVLQSQEKEEDRKNKTKLLISENPNRKKVKKINPKFCYEWSALETDLKINRLIEFVSRFSDENDLPAPTAKKLRKLLVASLVNETLDIDYDSTVGIVNSIPKLYYNEENGYYLGTYLNDKGEFIYRVSKITRCHNDSINQNLSIVTEDFKDEPKKKHLNLTKK